MVETGRDRAALAHDAGLGSLSFVSILAGSMCAFGAFAVLAAIAGGLLRAMDVNSVNDISGDWRNVGIGTAVILAAVMLVSYLFGGYVAGRMSRRAGALNGLMVFVLGILVGAGVGAAVSTQTNTDTVMSNLRSIGLPTSWDQWMAIGTIGGIAALVCMLAGSMLGGKLGERWHGKLVARAVDPTIGTDTVDLRDRDGEYVRTLDEERATTRERALVSAGHRPDGDHFGTRGDTTMADREADDVDWDGTNRTRTFDSTDSTLDDDLGSPRR